MEMINRAFEGADAFSKMMEKLIDKDRQLLPKVNDEKRYMALPLEGNRAERRAAAKLYRKSKAKV